MHKKSTSITCSAHFPSYQVYRPLSRFTMCQEYDLPLCRYPQEHPCTITTLQRAIYYRTRLFPSKELLLWGAFISLWSSPSRDKFCPCSNEEVPVPLTHEEKIYARPYALGGGCMPLPPRAMSDVPSLLRKWILYPLHIHICSEMWTNLLLCIAACFWWSWFPSSRCPSCADIENPCLFSSSWFPLWEAFEVLIPSSRCHCPSRC